jgi:tryptophan synthase alpha chain
MTEGPDRPGRIAQAFATAKAEGRAALVGYLTAFDPDLEGSRARILAACEAGLDVLELGVPFSDPTADGPAIQAAMVRALRSGATVSRVLELAAEVRQAFAGPIVLFSYANPLLRRGAEVLVQKAAEAGVDGLLVVDLPPEHASLVRDPAVAAGLDWIPLVAPTTPEDRTAKVVAGATGFVYAVTLKGVTGAKLHAGSPDVAARLAMIRRHTDRPIAAGFGVRTEDDVRTLSQHADGVVVGTALVAAGEESPEALASLVRALKAGTSRA